MKSAGTKRMQPWVQAGLALVLAFAAALPVAPVRAQDEEPPHFSDGEWQAVIVSNSHVSGPASVTGAAGGTAQFTVSEGVLEGTWSLEGSATLSGVASGSAEYITEGNVTGTADDPHFPTTGGHIHMVIQTDAGTVEMSQDVPAGESSFRINLINSICNQVTGTWEVSADNMTGSGTFVATRVSDLRDEDPSGYMERVTDLMADAMDFRDATIASGSLDVAVLDALLVRAQDLDSELRSSTECVASPVGDISDYHRLVAGIVADLLEFALGHPEEFDASTLRFLTTALVSTGATLFISEDTMNSLVDAIGDRLDAAIADGDILAIGNLIAAAMDIAAWDLVATGSAALGDE